MSKMHFLTDGLVKNNPTFVLVLGMCPTLATTTSAMNGLEMGLATMFVLILSNMVISLISPIVPDKVHIPVFKAIRQINIIFSTAILYIPVVTIASYHSCLVIDFVLFPALSSTVSSISVNPPGRSSVPLAGSQSRTTTKSSPQLLRMKATTEAEGLRNIS